MYDGWLTIGGVEIVNSHRTVAYAQTAGVAAVGNCTACSSIAAALKPSGYTTPLKDRPPWFSATDGDSIDFYGLMGLSVDGADDSVRSIDVHEGTDNGGYLGSMRLKPRTMVFRTIAVAGSECALNYGLEWLRSLNSTVDCSDSTVEMMACCPHVAQADCDDPTCAGTCVLRYRRAYLRARVTTGPEILRRIMLSHRGALAEVEFTIVAADPGIYTNYPAPVLDTPLSTAYDEPLAALTGSVTDVDPFAPVDPSPTPPSLATRSAAPTRFHWERQQVEIDAPSTGRDVVPVLTIESDAPVPDIRVTLIGDTDVLTYQMADFPAGGSVTMDFRTRQVITRAGGIEATHNTYVRDPTGAPMRWPKPLPRDSLTLVVDRAPGTPPLRVAAAAVGRLAG